MRWELVLPGRIAISARAQGEGVLPLEAMDSDAFAGFYQRSARPLWAYLARVSGDPALADDLMQESFVRYLSAPGRPVDGEVAARRYLFRIGTNLLRDHWRRPRTAAIEELPEELFAHTGTWPQVHDQALLGPALLKMRPIERQILWLAYGEGYTHKEVAEVTGLASASVRILLFRARRKITRLIREAESARDRQHTAGDDELRTGTRWL